MTQTENMYRELGISPAVYAFGQEIEKGLNCLLYTSRCV